MKTKSIQLLYFSTSFAQIKIYQMHINILKKHYKLSPGNKLYAVMYLITSNKVSKINGW